MEFNEKNSKTIVIINKNNMEQNNIIQEEPFVEINGNKIAFEKYFSLDVPCITANKNSIFNEIFII